MNSGYLFILTFTTDLRFWQIRDYESQCRIEWPNFRSEKGSPAWAARGHQLWLHPRPVGLDPGSGSDPRSMRGVLPQHPTHRLQMADLS